MHLHVINDVLGSEILTPRGLLARSWQQIGHCPEECPRQTSNLFGQGVPAPTVPSFIALTGPGDHAYFVRAFFVNIQTKEKKGRLAPGVGNLLPRGAGF